MHLLTELGIKFGNSAWDFYLILALENVSSAIPLARCIGDDAIWVVANDATKRNAGDLIKA